MKKTEIFVGLAYLSMMVITIVVYSFISPPKPLTAKDELNAECCSEEQMISIYEGTEDLKLIYDSVQCHIWDRDSINTNAITIKRLWEDSLKQMETQTK
jgi:hypothetical protein